MIAYMLAATVILVAVLELISRRDELRRLHVSFELDSKLTEPGERITLRYTVVNTSRFPVLFSSLTLRLNGKLRVSGSEEWRKVHLSEDFTGQQIEHRFYLLPYAKFSGRADISVNERGVHEIGTWYLERGDLLGLKPSMRSGEVPLKLICTAKLSETEDAEPLGGLIGDISVRRFINEDPSLVLGYREYTGREPMKDIAWLQTAKHNELTVRRNDFTTDRIAAVAVNMDETRRDDLETCLSLTRSVCEKLENAKIPYSVCSNGDIGDVPEGLGREHLFSVHRRIGLSRLAGHYSFGETLRRLAREKRGDVGVIIISAVPLGGYGAELMKLRRSIDREPFIICGGERK